MLVDFSAAGLGIKLILKPEYRITPPVRDLILFKSLGNLDSDHNVRISTAR